MSLRGTGAGRDHLRPKAPPEGPLAVWHNRTARTGIEIRICIPRSSRGLCLCSLTHARNKFRGLRRRFRRALGTGRARLNKKLFPYPRAHSQIQTDVQTEPCERKPFERNRMKSKPPPGQYSLTEESVFWFARGRKSGMRTVLLATSHYPLATPNSSLLPPHFLKYFAEIGNSKYVSGYGSSARRKCHHSHS